LIEVLEYDMGWASAHSTVSVGVALALGVGIMIPIGFVAGTARLVRALSIMPPEALPEERWTVLRIVSGVVRQLFEVAHQSPTTGRMHISRHATTKLHNMLC